MSSYYEKVTKFVPHILSSSISVSNDTISKKPHRIDNNSKQMPKKRDGSQYSSSSGGIHTSYNTASYVGERPVHGYETSQQGYILPQSQPPQSQPSSYQQETHGYETSQQGYVLPQSQPSSHQETVTIIVLGLTGSGKSTLIRQLTGDTSVKIGDTLESETRTGQVYITQNTPPNIPFRYQYLDTPGFNDTNRIDLDILEAIADALKLLRQNQQQIGGIIYTHRIVDDRIAGSSLNCLKVLKAICGPKNYSRIATVGMHWDKIVQQAHGTSLGQQRLLEIENDYLRDIKEKGGSFFPGNNESLGKIEQFFDHRCQSTRRKTNVKLQLEEQLGSGIGLPYTEAGQVVIKIMEMKVKEIKTGIKNLQAIAQFMPNPEEKAKLEAQLQILEQRIQGNPKNSHRADLQPTTNPPASSVPTKKYQVSLDNKNISKYLEMYWNCQKHYSTTGSLQPWPPEELTPKQVEEVETLLLSLNNFLEETNKSLRKLGAATHDVVDMKGLGELFAHCR
ncbi:hypothetical protein EDC01DRAFT_695687 [Geopyxis carbonaria]|nr:hypothetical protein EDC01DRAFT_695687 [Geopyxis carbonaria]